MITFLVSIALLIIAYFTYGKVIEKMFGVKEARPTPAYSMKDGVDYIPMGTNRNSLIQLLNIAGVGPIFGPIMGALYGPVAFIWIVVGCIFAGAVHDYLTGMISIRNKGAHLPQLAGKFLGKPMKHIVNAIAVLLLLLVGTVFVTAPAGLLFNLMDGVIALGIITAVIFAYYILATMLPVDKIIGKVYPILGALLVISAVGIGGMLIFTGAPIPELTLENMHPAGTAIFPILMITIACGAISGFHATQSPIISRTLQNEQNGRKVFYGMMIVEGIIAMIWAAAAMSLFYGTDLAALIDQGGAGLVVSEVAFTLLGAIGGTLAVLGVIVLPITSGDTAFRSARMIIADYIKVPQLKITSRLWIALPLFVISFILTTMDFTLLWRYFGVTNAAISGIALFVGAMYLAIQYKFHWVATIPAIFMTMVSLTFIFSAPIGFGLPMSTAYVAATVGTIIILALFAYKLKLNRAEANFEIDEDVNKVA
ncbi:carbon starvation protein A [Halalkalibacter wakoensis JCM 9140]|uniref:Carbon starvation protein A n=1 Tax=Halalkalibacter wakoensis JCM 9140 TaxID=1236970 RepID=W4Q1C4_9BACI|nr:carbon starvation CstA family protein [Halalkalibacter wakoensis]GAE25503.1 carbon starvation protein A [Halalkalibacter wakoensis JCM 9140]